MCKKIQSILFFAVVFIIAMSCTKEQSELSIEDVPGKVKIIGYICYDAGTEYSKAEDKVDVVYSAAANKQIFVEVPNNAFKAGAEGVITYQTKTDYEGNYQIEVPIGNSDMMVTIKGETFLGEREVYDGMVKDKPIYEKEDVVFYLSKNVTVSPNVFSVVDMEYNNEPRDIKTN